MEALETLKRAQSEAQDELVLAEMSLLEASARAEKAREEASKLDAAVAALSGEPPPAAETLQRDGEEASHLAHNQEIAGSIPAPATKNPDRANTAEMSKEEFEEYVAKRRRQKKKEELDNNPYAHVKCSGCGSMGTMQDVIMTAPSGAPVRMMACGSCGNQIIT